MLRCMRTLSYTLLYREQGGGSTRIIYPKDINSKCVYEENKQIAVETDKVGVTKYCLCCLQHPQPSASKSFIEVFFTFKIERIMRLI